MLLEGRKVITAEEMARIEKISYSRGYSDLAFMEKAGQRIAEITLDFVKERRLEREVSLLVGKGNNGGDAYAAGVNLLNQGFHVQAFHYFPLDVCSTLCLKQQEKFKTAGGTIHLSDEVFHHPLKGVVLDGLVGTGFSGKAEGILARAIETANCAGLPILSIDIPSGLSGNSGKVETVAIRALITIYLGFPKWGFFTQPGWEHVGNLIGADFGLPEEEKREAKAIAMMGNFQDISQLLPPVKRCRHKYDAGYILGIAGSTALSGAALLSGLAALRSGAGMVRLFFPEEAHLDMLKAPLELIKEAWDLKDFDRIFEEAKKAKVFFLGPGIGRNSKTEKMVQQFLKKAELPLVIDADALYFLGKHPEWPLPPQTILTPHHGEMKRLLNSEQEVTPSACQQYVEAKNATLVLKGAPTFIFHPQTLPLIMTGGDPGLATAGTGDVLTGIISAMLAQGLKPREAAFLAVYLHGVSGEIAASQRTSYSMIASDVIDCLSKAFSELVYQLTNFSSPSAREV